MTSKRKQDSKFADATNLNEAATEDPDAEDPSAEDIEAEATGHSHEVTQLLLRWSDGDKDALSSLMPLVCRDLRNLARGYLEKESPAHTLQPTALVNEVYLKLHDRRTVSWKNSAHFFGFAATTMRRILVDHARSHQRAKRGDGVRPLPLDESLDLIDDRKLDMVALDDALNQLAELDPRQASIVELRFFVGLTVEETAAVLEISPPTVKREWRLARLLLYRELS